MRAKILTKPSYWNNLCESGKSQWQNTANAMAANGRTASVAVCTHRPDLRDHRGSEQVRRCSTGGKYGKSADIVSMSVESLLAAGYVWRTYIPRAELVEASREAVYSNDTH